MLAAPTLQPQPPTQARPLTRRSHHPAHPCSAYLTFVALSRKDPAGGPPTRLALPKVVPTDRYHEQIHSEAARRWGLGRAEAQGCGLRDREVSG